ncbi:MAG: serine hydrolase domain-containing protein [Vicinamibacterales bacterium]
MRRLIGLPLAVLLLAGAPARANDILLATFRDYLDAIRVQTAIPGLAASIIGRDDVLWMHAYGRQNVERNVATTIDTPFHVEGLTQVFTSVLILRCVDLGLITLDDPVGLWVPDAPEPEATIAQLLSHSTSSTGVNVFTHNNERLNVLAGVLTNACTSDSFRETLATEFDILGMSDSVPGADALDVAALEFDETATPSRTERYQLALGRLATPYTLDADRRPVASAYSTTTLTPSAGVITTVQDYARFDLALKRGEVVRPETLAASWQPPVDENGQPLPHAAGWFVQTFNGERILWQFGVSDSGSSSMVMMAPGRGLTLVLLANGPGLVRPFALEKGDLVASPFGRLFLGMLVR